MRRAGELDLSSWRLALNGAETVDQYDSLGRLTKETRSAPGLGQRYGDQDIVLTEKTYDGAGNVRFSTDANGNTTEYRYDGANRLRVKIEAQGPSGPVGVESRVLKVKLPKPKRAPRRTKHHGTKQARP